jgi:acyl carrier protein
VNRSLLKREATFQELGLDSLSQVEAIVALEEMFGVNLSDEEAEKINTINDAITIFHLRV